MDKELKGLLRLMSKPIAFQRIFVEWTGSVNAALLLSQLVYWTQITDDPEGWVYKSKKEWARETGLSRFEQEQARKTLRKLKLVREKRNRFPATVHFQITDEFCRFARDTQLARNSPSAWLETRHLSSRARAHNAPALARARKTENTTDIVPRRNGVPSRDTSSGSFFGKEDIYSNFVKNACHRLEEFIRVSRKLQEHRFNRQKWYADMTLLLKKINGNKRRLRKVLKFYINNSKAHKDCFPPVIESAGSFNEKFFRVEDWIDRVREKEGEEDPSQEVVTHRS